MGSIFTNRKAFNKYPYIEPIFMKGREIISYANFKKAKATNILFNM